jgi:hypothetical protein
MHYYKFFKIVYEKTSYKLKVQFLLVKTYNFTCALIFVRDNIKNKYVELRVI